MLKYYNENLPEIRNRSIRKFRTFDASEDPTKLFEKICLYIDEPVLPLEEEKPNTNKPTWEDTPNIVLDWVFLGNEEDAKDLYTLKKKGITNIVNFACCQDYHPKEFEYFSVYIPDRPVEHIRSYWPKMIEFIDNAKEKGGKTLIHCHMGMSRAASSCCAYVMQNQKYDLTQTFQFVSKARGIIFPNEGFLAQLSHFEFDLYGKRSMEVQTRWLDYHKNPPLYEDVLKRETEFRNIIKNGGNPQTTFPPISKPTNVNNKVESNPTPNPTPTATTATNNTTTTQQQKTEMKEEKKN